MIEYETFAYFGVPKTGSTFIADFLQRFCSEQCLLAEQHKPVSPERYSPQKLYIISVRNPLDQYLSLYSYGVDGRGRVHSRLANLGHEALYDGSKRGFHRWLKLVLQPENAHLLSKHYAAAEDGRLAEIVGYQSFNHLRLASPWRDAAVGKDALRRTFERNSIVGFVIRNEQLNSDLATLVRTRLQSSFSDPAAALRYLETAERINASTRVDLGAEAFDVKDKLRTQLQEREWLLHELFGY